jgi:hypothetical protein
MRPSVGAGAQDRAQADNALQIANIRWLALSKIKARTKIGTGGAC